MSVTSGFSDKNNPLLYLKEWMREAREAGVKEPEAAVLSTVTWRESASLWETFFVLLSYGARRSLKPTSRVVLIKDVNTQNLVFYTNYKSLKGRQIKRQNSVALNFYWEVLGRQVRLEGRVKKTSLGHSLKYWNTRSFESRISQYVSQQSQELKSKAHLTELWQAAYKKFFASGKVPCPAHWGGYFFTPHLVEFWTAHPHRLHERVQFKRKKSVFSKTNNDWYSLNLYP